MTYRSLFSIGLILFFVSPLAHAAPDFSKFVISDPNEAISSDDSSRTEAEPPCVHCQLNQTPRSQRDSQQVIQRVQGSRQVTRQAQRTEPECYSCGRVNLARRGTVSGENIWKNFPEIAGYSEHPEVKAMIRYAETHSRSTSIGLCLRRVKEAMCRARRGTRCKGGSLVSKYMNFTPVFPEVPSRSNPKIGVNALKNLKAEGFINLLDDSTFSSMIQNPASAPKGAIMIYKGGKNGGHIEIKTGHGTSGSYVSDFRAPNSVMKNELAGRASRNYKLVGVMIKPAEKLK
ncbi:hypothetical protein [Bdellovibrio sp. HCB337]|uniref:hypothetical protein n=1 Tax=Bdellovibrio sp. HCB337 TaxID=3394358 RepID=UPI0039A5A378